MDDEPEDRAPARTWQLDKRIPAALLIAIFMQSFCVVIWATKLDGRVNALETNTVNGEKFARLDEKVTSVKEDLTSLKLDIAGIRADLRTPIRKP